jgi:hypothetical protein
MANPKESAIATAGIASFLDPTIATDVIVALMLLSDGDIKGAAIAISIAGGVAAAGKIVTRLAQRMQKLSRNLDFENSQHIIDEIKKINPKKGKLLQIDFETLKAEVNLLKKHGAKKKAIDKFLKENEMKTKMLKIQKYYDEAHKGYFAKVEVDQSVDPTKKLKPKGPDSTGRSITHSRIRGKAIKSTLADEVAQLKDLHKKLGDDWVIKPEKYLPSIQGAKSYSSMPVVKKWLSKYKGYKTIDDLPAEMHMQHVEKIGGKRLSDHIKDLTVNNPGKIEGQHILSLIDINKKLSELKGMMKQNSIPHGDLHAGNIFWIPNKSAKDGFNLKVYDPRGIKSIDYKDFSLHSDITKLNNTQKSIDKKIATALKLFKNRGDWTAYSKVKGSLGSGTAKKAN